MGMDDRNSGMSKLTEVIGKCTGKNVIKVIAGKKGIREHTTEQECRDAGCEGIRRGKIIKNYPSQPLSGTARASPTGSRVTSDNIRNLEADVIRALHRFRTNVGTQAAPTPRSQYSPLHQNRGYFADNGAYSQTQ